MKTKFIGVVTDFNYDIACREHPGEFYKDFKVPYGGDYYHHKDIILLLNKLNSNRFYLDEYPEQKLLRKEYLQSMTEAG